MEFDDTRVPTGQTLEGSQPDDSSEAVGERLGGLGKVPTPGFETRRLRDAVMAELFDEPSEPSKIGRFTIVRRVGAGGMGVVYVAYDERLDRRVAVKLLRGGSVSEVARARLEREAKAMAKLSHPNVVTVYDVGTFDAQTYVAMEFIDGEDLRRWCEAGPHPWRAVLEVFAQAGAGLVAAHDAGIVHRDFKPDNVLVGRGGRARVADFGLANAFEGLAPDPESPPAPEADTGGVPTQPGASGSLTRTGTVMGTPAYMAPEQHAGTGADARSDQFSFCVALWEALYGERPFEANNYAALAAAVRRGELHEPARAAEVPPWLRATVRRGLEVDPEARWPSMAALLEALASDPQARRRRLLRWVGGAVAIAATISGLLWFAVLQLRDSARQRYWSALTEDLLELERERGLRQANDDTRRARDAARMSAMREYMPTFREFEREDPTAAAALLMEVSEEVRGSSEWISAANTLLGQPLSRAVLRGHGDSITPLMFTPDGRWLYSGSEDGQVWRWDPLTGEGELVIQHGALVTDLDISPDGKLLASSSEDGTLRTWNADTREASLRIDTGFGIRSVAFDPQGRRLVAGGRHKSVELLDLSTNERTTLRAGGSIHAVRFDARGERVIAGGTDARVHIWSARDGREQHVLSEHEAPIYQLLTIPDGRFVTGSDDGTARLWAPDAAGAQHTLLVQHASEISVLVLDRDAQRVAAGTIGGEITVVDLAPPHARTQLPAHPRAVWGLAFTPSGEHLISGSLDKTARRVRSDGRGVPEVMRGHHEGLFRIAIDPSGTWLATGSYDATIRLWPLERRRLTIPLLGHRNTVIDAAFDPAERRLVTASHDGTARLWSVDEGTLLATLEGEGQFQTARFSPDGDHVAIAGASVHLWQPSTGEIRQLDGMSGTTWALSFDASGARLATANFDRSARIWDVADAREVARYEHDAEVWGVDFEPDGERLITICADGLVRAWDTQSGELVAKLRGHTGRILALARSPDGSVLATGADDNTARLWRGDLASDAIVLAGHTRAVFSLSFDPTGQRLVTSSPDGHVRVWKVDDGGLLHDFDVGEAAWSVRFLSPNELIAGLNDGRVTLWSLPSGRELTLEGHGSGVARVTVSPSGRRAITSSADHSALLWQLDNLDFDDDELFARLRATTRYCLSPTQRTSRLGESPTTASEAATACARENRR